MMNRLYGLPREGFLHTPPGHYEGSVIVTIVDDKQEQEQEQKQKQKRVMMIGKYCPWRQEVCK